MAVRCMKHGLRGIVLWLLFVLSAVNMGVHCLVAKPTGSCTHHLAPTHLCDFPSPTCLPPPDAPTLGASALSGFVAVMAQ